MEGSLVVDGSASATTVVGSVITYKRVRGETYAFKGGLEESFLNKQQVDIPVADELFEFGNARLKTSCIEGDKRDAFRFLTTGMFGLSINATHWIDLNNARCSE